jgi:hypothetical protein
MIARAVPRTNAGTATLFHRYSFASFGYDAAMTSKT